MPKVKLSHGAGGRAMQRLLKEMVVSRLASDVGEVRLSEMDDSAIVDGIVFTTDSHTVKPLFFPGGDIGSLSIAGTVNDLAVMGAEPIALSLAMVVEEGLDLDILEKVIGSVARTARKAGVSIVTGDTKVMERGAVDKLVLNTSGIGRRHPLLDRNLYIVQKYRKFAGKWPRDSTLAGGDALVVSGTIGDHGVAILSAREGYGFESEVRSDAAPMNHAISEALDAGGVVAMKDPTRGGLANALNEFSEKSGVGIEIDEAAIPIKPGVRSACGMLGLDPMEIGNEGKVLFGVVGEKASDVLKSLRKTPEGRQAAIIGRASKKVRGVVMRTKIGGRRIVEPPIGDPVPRIC
ncbi:MAG: hydrogenase expression/formation protein HypE [Euryarchaeota archaeon]|nr:hydrogenase expression/formation protein HypE [Euryarchaeota archaeon]